MKLPQQLNLPQTQTKWAAAIEPVLNSSIVSGVLLNNVHLINGVTVVNHTLGRNLRGYIIVLQNASANIYDSQDTNQMPNLTLVLNSSAAVTVSLWCF